MTNLINIPKNLRFSPSLRRSWLSTSHNKIANDKTRSVIKFLTFDKVMQQPLTITTVVISVDNYLARMNFSMTICTHAHTVALNVPTVVFPWNYSVDIQSFIIVFRTKMTFPS